MTPSNAIDRIFVHAGLVLVNDDPGFLGRLRPFQGLRMADFADLMQSLVVIHPGIATSVLVQRELCGALWYISEYTRTFLKHHAHVASASEVSVLSKWIDSFEVFAVRMYSGNDLAQCLSTLMDYIMGEKCDNCLFKFLVPHLMKMMHSDDAEVASYASATLAVLNDANRA